MPKDLNVSPENQIKSTTPCSSSVNRGLRLFNFFSHSVWFTSLLRVLLKVDV